MIAKLDDGRFRWVLGKRYPLEHPHGQSQYEPRRGTGIGAITSRSRHATTDAEWIAFRHGITVTQAEQLLREGIK